MDEAKPQTFQEAQKARFWNKVVKTDGCWLWTGTIDKCGYGSVKIAGRSRRVHRVAHEMHHGPIPDGLHVDHLCHNQDLSCDKNNECPHRRCVNPAHLEAVTPKVNAQRGRSCSAAMARRTHCRKGHPYASNAVIDRDGIRRCKTCREGAAEGRDRRKRMTVTPEATQVFLAYFPGEGPTAVVKRALLLLAEVEGRMGAGRPDRAAS